MSKYFHSDPKIAAKEKALLERAGYPLDEPFISTGDCSSWETFLEELDEYVIRRWGMFSNMNSISEEVGEGPCVDVRGGRVLSKADFHAELQSRWDSYILEEELWEPEQEAAEEQEAAQAPRHGLPTRAEAKQAQKEAMQSLF